MLMSGGYMLPQFCHKKIKRLLTKMCMIYWITISSSIYIMANDDISKPYNLSVVNKLKPFTSDGCSRFPDGIPLLYPQLWQLCCVIHDIAYWKGGTQQQRLSADQDLKACVKNVIGYGLGQTMFLGVRLGGYVGLPFTWRWGYGWTQNRGYLALTQNELEQINDQLFQLPQNIQDLPITNQSTFEKRDTLSGDYCIDEAAKDLVKTLGDQIKIISVKETVENHSLGYWKSLYIEIENCTSPYLYSFLLLHRNACITPMNELLARGRIRLMNIQRPKICEPINFQQ